MLGGLLTLTALAVFDALGSRSVASVRNLLFIVITSAACVFLSGLPEVLWPGIPERLVILLKVSMGPLSGAVALNYLGIWLGGMREDEIVHRVTSWGAGALLLSALAQAVMATLASREDFGGLLQAAAVINFFSVVLAFSAAAQAATMGDPLARWMVVACAFLGIMVSGLYLRALRVEGFGLGTWIVTAVSTVSYFLIVSVLVIMRTRENRKLARLAGLQFGADPATGLPTGSVLLSEVEHAFWRTARLHGECTVVCLHLSNLYELGETAGHGVEHQILAAMAARIRRAAGFRCVVGLYHQRCFVVVISGHKRRQFVTLTVERLRSLIAEPLNVVGRDQARHEFTPQLGVGVITLDPTDADPLEVINRAERLALVPASESEDAANRSESELVDTTPSTLEEEAAPASPPQRPAAARRTP
jgi:GGDEF domain-containing protein